MRHGEQDRFINKGNRLFITSETYLHWLVNSGTMTLKAWETVYWVTYSDVQ